MLKFERHLHLKQLQLKSISTTLEDIKEKLSLSYTENPLFYIISIAI